MASKPLVIVAMGTQRLSEDLMNEELWKRLESVARIDRKVVTDFHDSANRARIAEAEYVFAGWGVEGQLDVTALDAMPKLRAVVSAMGDSRRLFDAESLAVARERGIRLSNSGYVNGTPVAEYCLAVILLANKEFFAAERLYRERRAEVNHETAFPDSGNYMKTVGLVTASSRIGRQLMTLLRPHRLRVLAQSIDMDEAETASYGAEKADLETVFRESDVVSLHTPNLPATRGMIDAKYFHMMKDGAWFINSARGGVVNADDMIAELKTGRIRAILDVTDPDEPLPPDSPLWDMPNVILTPHIAGSAGTELMAMGENVVEEITRDIHGEPMRYAE